MDNTIKYIDNWVIDGTIMNGELIINKNNGEIELTLYQKSDNYIKFNQYYEYITTVDNSYNRITLLKCYYLGFGDSHTVDNENDELMSKYKYRFKIYYCIDNYLLKNTELKIDFMGFNISYLFNWADINKYNFKFDEEHDFILCSKKIEEKIIYSCDEYIIYYKIINKSFNMALGQESYFFNQYPLILIESKGRTIDFYIDIISKIIIIMKIAIGKNVSIRDIIGGINKKEYTVYHNTPQINYENNYSYDHLFNLFNMDDLINFSNINKWFSVYEKMKLIIDIYCDNITNEYKSVENKFINTVTALESYHSKVICKGNSNINNFIDEFKIRKGEDIFDILFKDIITNKSITLRMRLLDLLRNMITVFEIDSSEDEFSKRVVDTRNYLVHGNDYNKNIYKKTELYMINDFLMQILCFYIIKELNFNEILFESIVRRIKQRHCMYLYI